jgi:hypothetical protein
VGGKSKGNSNGVTGEEGRIIMPGPKIKPCGKYDVGGGRALSISILLFFSRADVVERSGKADAVGPQGEMQPRPHPKMDVLGHYIGKCQVPPR